MSGYRLCQTKMAEVPYYIENISTNIYSMEELCYYLQHNIYLLDETIIGEGLCDWIRDEFGLKQLYQRLYKEQERGSSLGDFVLPVFKEINYLTHEEFKALNEKLLRLEHEPAVQRQKLKADYLVEHGKYINALRVYKATLAKARAEKLGGQFFGEIYHNMGCAHMRMFQYDEALECFRGAYENMPTETFLRDYLTAFYLAKPQDKFEQEAAALHADAALVKTIEEQVSLTRSSVGTDELPRDMEEFLEQLTGEYHTGTGL